MLSNIKENKWSIVYAFWLLFLISLLASWFTHVIVCIKASSWLFLIAGAICAPIGIIHGYGVWFGIW